MDSEQYQRVNNPPLTTNNSRYDRLVRLLIKKIEPHTHVYFDYDFVCHFTYPNCGDIHSSNPSFEISPTSAGFAQRVFEYLSANPRQFDDCISIILDSLVSSRFIKNYVYLGGPFRESLHPKCSGKTYYDFFRIHSFVSGLAISHWGSAKINTLEFDTTQFIDKHGFILGVGNWEIDISEEACEFTRNLSPKVQIYRNFKTKKLYIRNRQTGAEKYIGGKRKWCPDMFAIFDELLHYPNSGISVYEITQLLKRKEIKYTPDVNGLLDLENNQLKTFDEVLWSIDVPPDEVYSYKDNIFSLKGEQEIKFFTGF